jgi:hypothetical protein
VVDQAWQPRGREFFPAHLRRRNTMFGGPEVGFLSELRHLHDGQYKI